MNYFGHLLEERGENVFSVSKKMGIPQATLYDFKAGRRVPRAETLQKIADYFGVSSEYLLNGSTEEKYYEDPLTAELAEKMKDGDELRVLFSAAKDAKPETLRMVYEILLTLKKQEKRTD